jgi:hypothetical protein
MIICRDATADEVAAVFQTISSKFMTFTDLNESIAESLTLRDCWEAVHCAKAQGWIDFVSNDPDIDRCIDMEEYMHYDNPANGGLHVIIPSRLIAFPRPSAMPKDPETGEAPQWRDAGGQRSFGASYFADVLGDFGVSLVVRCVGDGDEDDNTDEEGESEEDEEDESGDEEEDVLDDEYKTEGGDDAEEGDAEFAARGMAVEWMEVSRDERPGSLLRSVDRFLTLAGLAPGALAIHGDGAAVAGGGAAAGGGLGGGAEVLVSALLIKRFGFRARSALAWLRITQPSAARPALRFSVLPVDDPSPPPPLPLPARRCSLPVPVDRSLECCE